MGGSQHTHTHIHTHTHTHIHIPQTDMHTHIHTHKHTTHTHTHTTQTHTHKHTHKHTHTNTHTHTHADTHMHTHTHSNRRVVAGFDPPLPLPLPAASVSDLGTNLMEVLLMAGCHDSRQYDWCLSAWLRLIWAKLTNRGRPLSFVVGAAHGVYWFRGRDTGVSGKATLWIYVFLIRYINIKERISKNKRLPCEVRLFRQCKAVIKNTQFGGLFLYIYINI